MEKKPYAPPTITEHGNVVEQTRGVGGDAWELYSTKLSDYDYPPPPPRD
ncbi:MAG: lasso RiPP family leader peptide-containing protein [Gemmatimonadota bacterium]